MINFIRIGFSMEDFDRLDIGEIYDISVTYLNMQSDAEQHMQNQKETETNVRKGTVEDLRKIFG